MTEVAGWKDRLDGEQLRQRDAEEHRAFVVDALPDLTPEELRGLSQFVRNSLAVRGRGTIEQKPSLYSDTRTVLPSPSAQLEWTTEQPERDQSTSISKSDKRKGAIDG